MQLFKVFWVTPVFVLVFISMGGRSIVSKDKVCIQGWGVKLINIDPLKWDWTAACARKHQLGINQSINHSVSQPVFNHWINAYPCRKPWSYQQAHIFLIHAKTTTPTFFFLPFPNPFFSSPLVFLPLFVHRFSRVATLSLWSLSSSLSLLCDEMISRRGSAVASLEEESSFYRHMKYGAPSLKASGCDWGKRVCCSFLDGEEGVFVCMASLKTTHTFLITGACSRHQTIGEALVK